MLIDEIFLLNLYIDRQCFIVLLDFVLRFRDEVSILGSILAAGGFLLTELLIAEDYLIAFHAFLNRYLQALIIWFQQFLLPKFHL